MSNTPANTWGHDEHRLLTLVDAVNIVIENVRVGGATEEMKQVFNTKRVGLGDAHGRVLAESVLIDEDYPAFDKAMMDGFAVRSADCASGGIRLRIVGLAAAGDAPAAALSPGQAMRINTGAPVPGGADAVARVEDTREENCTVVIQIAIKAGTNVNPRGLHRKKGDVALAPPVILGPAQIAAAASAGVAEVAVARRIGCAIVVTGDELVPVGGTRRLGQIYESNGLMLSALVRQFGGMPFDLGIVADEATVLREKLREALRQPLVVTAGGMSMGTLDLVPKVFAELGVHWLFHGVEMRPGRPVAYGRGPDGQHVVGLPGNPVSAFVCAWLFVRMIVRGSMGLAVALPPMCTATLTKELKPARDARPAFIPARTWHENGRLLIEPVRWGGSDDLFGLAQSDALLCRASPMTAASAGAQVECILLDGSGRIDN